MSVPTGIWDIGSPISSAGSVLAATYIHVRGIITRGNQFRKHIILNICRTATQESGRLGILPGPEFLSDVTLYSKPANALLIHFIAASVFIIAAPLDGTDLFLLLGTIAAFSEAVIGGKMARWAEFILKMQEADSVAGCPRTGILGVAMLFARWIKSFKKQEGEWQPQRFRHWRNWLVLLVTAIFVITNIIHCRSLLASIHLERERGYCGSSNIQFLGSDYLNDSLQYCGCLLDVGSTNPEVTQVGH